MTVAVTDDLLGIWGAGKSEDLMGECTPANCVCGDGLRGRRR
jgi:hypothetical protein